MMEPTTTSSNKLECMHGSPEDPTEVQARQAAMVDYLRRDDELLQKCLAEKSHGVKERLKLFQVYWSLHGHLVDDLLVRLLYAHATEAYLQGAATQAYQAASMAMRFEYSLNKTLLSPGNPSTVMADCGLVQFLWRKVPCSCLADKKREVKRTPKKLVCFTCFQEELAVDMKKCGRCNVATYCSKECQEIDWSHHKRGCKLLWKKMDQE